MSTNQYVSKTPHSAFELGVIKSASPATAIGPQTSTMLSRASDFLKKLKAEYGLQATQLDDVRSMRGSYNNMLARQQRLTDLSKYGSAIDEKGVNVMASHFTQVGGITALGLNKDAGLAGTIVSKGLGLAGKAATGTAKAMSSVGGRAAGMGNKTIQSIGTGLQSAASKVSKGGAGLADAATTAASQGGRAGVSAAKGVAGQAGTAAKNAVTGAAGRAATNVGNVVPSTFGRTAMGAGVGAGIGAGAVGGYMAGSNNQQ